MITDTKVAVTGVRVLEVLTRALDEALRASSSHAEVEPPKLTADDIAAALMRPADAPVLGQPARIMPSALRARATHRLLDLKRRRLVTHQRQTEVIDGVSLLVDRWAITLDGALEARRGLA